VQVDCAICSTLRRTSQSLDIMLGVLGQKPPVVRSWRMNEQHCGALTGWNKRQLAIEYGEERVRRWRRDPQVRPPAASATLPEIVLRLGSVVGRVEHRRSCSLAAPRCESMVDACNRYRPFYRQVIVPMLRRGQTVLCAGHGNMLRGAVREVEGLSDAQLSQLELPQATPLVFHFDENMRLVEPSDDPSESAVRMDGIQGVLLGDAAAVRAAQQASAAAHTFGASKVGRTRGKALLYVAPRLSV
jgi:2,3-bisphosphoglycerate-dependent phosphoglycerate mutase